MMAFLAEKPLSRFVVAADIPNDFNKETGAEGSRFLLQTEKSSNPLKEASDGIDHFADSPDKTGLFHFRSGELVQRSLNVFHVGSEGLGVQPLQRSAEPDQLADLIAKSLERRAQLLRLLSMNNFDMEENSRGELLTSFKRAYGQSIKNFRMILEKHCSGLSRSEADQIIYVFFPFRPVFCQSCPRRPCKHLSAQPFR